MQTEELKRAAERTPFQPFGIRLSNGAQYFFNQPRDFGARRDFNTIVFFGEKEIVLIDTDNIVDVFSK
jgi:hypothetical protein